MFKVSLLAKRTAAHQRGEVGAFLKWGGFPRQTARKVPVIFNTSLVSFYGLGCSGYYMSYPDGHFRRK